MFDGSGRVVSLAVPGLGLTSVAYDGEGRVALVRDPAGGAIRYTYDANGNRTSATDQLGRSAVTQYTETGRVAQTTDRTGAVTAYSYDSFSRVAAIDAAGEHNGYTYDGAGRLIEIDGTDAQVVVGYDAADRPIRIATAVRGGATTAVDYGYDAAGRRSTMTYAGTTKSYGFDAAGRLASVTTPVGVFRIAYDSAGRQSSVERPNGVKTSYAYGPGGDVTDISHTRGGTRVDGTRYSYDAAGRRTVVAQADGEHVYSYDAAGQVLAADHPSGESDEAFGYDERGNRISDAGQYDAANRLSSRSGFSYSYDDERRTVARREISSGKVTSFSWDAHDRLRSVAAPDGTVTRYLYDPFGRRIQATGSGQTTTRVFGLDANPVADSTTGGFATRYTFAGAPDTPLMMQRDGRAVYFEQDASSTVTSLSDQAGAVTARYSYDAFGRVTAKSGSDTSPFTFTGREWNSASRTYDYRAREYDPSIGRFLTEDPVEGTNGYVYAFNAPASFVDPTGKTTESEELTVVSIVDKWQFQAGINAVISGVSAATKCDASFGKVALAMGVGGVSGAAGGWLTKRLYNVMRPLAGGGSVSQMFFNAKMSMLMASALGSSLSIGLAGVIDGEDPGQLLLGMVAGAITGWMGPGV